MLGDITLNLPTPPITLLKDQLGEGEGVRHLSGVLNAGKEIYNGWSGVITSEKRCSHGCGSDIQASHFKMHYIY